MRVIHISLGGPDRKIRDEAGGEFMFEDHPIFGPAVVDRHGNPKDKQPGKRASFWRVWHWWADQGKQIDRDGFCIWKEPPQPKLEHIAGNHYRVIYDEPATPTEWNQP